MRAAFPTIAEMCRRVGLDLARDPIPVGPAAHYIMGGVDTDEWGRTSLPGLFAAGEVACTGVHGANRLASNSLLEGLVFGARAAAAMQRAAAGGGAEGRSRHGRGSGLRPDARAPSSGLEARPPIADDVRDLMWRRAGLFRTREGLQDAVATLDAASRRRRVAAPTHRRPWRHLNLLTVARLIARAALRREESRGGHFRADFPERDDRHWKVHSSIDSHKTQTQS